ncbi:nucleic acid binding [Dermatophagoides pteronyssinus]|uniref:Nucleic acid binding n=2 Tax=Dermatophagoides pteronyssinus TaxID=6956 RepID=A0ABQ8JIK9_DERPT|nr:E3 ubiquitin-protein ligase Hakai-like [Dermatophagoides pteronyssinus]KAH9422449.1 nucleic acid binding [Dermatophagoides pteronyssinus]
MENQPRRESSTANNNDEQQQVIGNDDEYFGSFSTSLISPPFGHTNQLQLRNRANLVGEKIINPGIHMCDSCQSPILVYGRMIPCKHVFCFDCADKSPEKCLRCSNNILKIEKCKIGTVFICRTDTCRRTYLSQRDLDAHIQHRHLRRSDGSLRF